MKKPDYAERVLKELQYLDHETTESYYEMGQLLYAVKQSKLYDNLGYSSMSHMVEEELSFTPGTASRYLTTYYHFKRLGYSKTEALKVLQEFGITHVSEYLPGARAKVGLRAIKRAIDNRLESYQQINFTLDREDYQRVLKLLESVGCKPGENGRLQGSSEALMTLIDRIDKRSKSKLKLAA